MLTMFVTQISSILHPYDFRGRYPDVLNDAAAFFVARAFADTIRERVPEQTPVVAVGRDARPSGIQLERAVVRGLTEGGVEVVRLGLVSTPTFYFSVAFNGYNGGVQITASHNPSGDNGLKLVGARAEPIDVQNGLRELASRAESRAFLRVAHKGLVRERSDTTEQAVREYCKSFSMQSLASIRVLADAGNGMGALDMAATFQRLPCTATPLYFRLDGTFPNRGPDPSIDANLHDIQRAIVSEGADVGFAADGDGDRYFVLDEKGRVVPHAILRGLVAMIALKQNTGAKICYDVRPGRATKEMILSAGGVPVLTPVGSPFIKTIMQKEGAVAGVESSGHFLYRFPFGIFEAPAFFLTSFLLFLAEQKKPLSEIIAPYKTYAHSGEISIPVSHPAAVVEHVRKVHADGDISILDGVSVDYPHWWFNLRPSNTEPLVRLTVEAVTHEAMEKGRDQVLREIAEAK